MTLLMEDGALWDIVFRESPGRLRFLVDTCGKGASILDVGCATGSLCMLLRRRGVRTFGVDINPVFIETARAKDPEGDYEVGDMRALRLRRKFDAIVCVGTTFAYNLDHPDIMNTLRAFHRHLRAGGLAIIDVLNAAAFMGPQPFRRLTKHTFSVEGRRVTASIAHTLKLREQLLTEQVTWRGRGALRRDPTESLRLFFPQELSFYLEAAGFSQITLTDRHGPPSAQFGGRRLVAIARRLGGAPARG